MKKNSKTFKKVAPLALVGLLATGALGASAWLSTSERDESIHTIQAGTFKLTIDQGEGMDVGFESLKAFPVSDEVGKTGTEGVKVGTFTVKNTGEVSQVVRLFVSTEGYVNEIDTAENGKKLIHLYVTDGTGKEIYNGTLADAYANDKGFGEVTILNGGAAGAGESVTYNVRMWIDSNAQNADIIKTDGSGMTVNAKLGVLGVQNDGGITADKNVISSTEFENMATSANLSRVVGA